MNLKNLLPFDNFRLVTKLASAEVKSRIERSIEPEQYFNLSLFNNRQMPYEGELIGDSFKISRVINYRNSFLPIIRGEIYEGIGQTEVVINMRPVVFVIIFMSVWLGVIGMVCLGAVILAIIQITRTSTISFSPLVLIPFFMFAFGCCLMLIPYKIESRKSKAFLKQLLEAEES